MGKYLKILFIITLLGCNKEVTVSEPDYYLRDTAKIYLNSKPAGSKIVIDGKFSGLYTPDTIKWLKPMKYEITLINKILLDYSFSVDLSSNDTQEYFHNYYNYPDNFPEVTLHFNPVNSKIYFNDSLYSIQSPFVSKKIFPGYYTIRGEYPEHRTDSIKVLIKSGKKIKHSLNLIDTTNFVTYNSENSQFHANWVSDIYIDKDDKKWIATRDKGIIIIDRGKYTYLTMDNSILKTNTVFRLKPDNNDNIWICTYKGLIKYHNGIFSSYNQNDCKPLGKSCLDIAFDNQNNAWIATSSGLVKFDGNNFKVFDKKNSDFSITEFNTVATNEEGHIWIGTNSFGIYKYDGKTWKHFTEESHNLPSKSVNKIFTFNGCVFVSFIPNRTDGLKGGIMKYENDNWTQLDFALNDKYFNNFYADKDDNIWISSKYGFIKYMPDGSYRKFSTENSKIKVNNITALSFDSKMNLWIGSKEGGLTKYKTWKDSNF